jgi:hypothetical protein
MRAWVLLLMLSFGCQKPSTASDDASNASTAAKQPMTSPSGSRASREPNWSEQAQTLVPRVKRLAELHAAHANDCNALTRELERFEAGPGRALASTPPQAYAAIEADRSLAVQLHEHMESIMTVSMSCHGNEAFQRFHERRKR